MLKMETAPYERKRTVDIGSFTKEDLFLCIISFFIARAPIIDNLTPFGIGFLSAHLLNGISISIPLSIILGLLSFHGFNGIRYIISILLIIIVHNHFKKEKKLSILNMSLISAGTFSVVGVFGLLITKQFYFYDLFTVLFEGLVVFTLSYIFSYSYPIGVSLEENTTRETILCTFATLALALSGINISLIGISLKSVISILLVLSFGYSVGPSWGGGMGITIGLISYISSPEMPFLLSIYALSGLLSGVFRDLGKAGSIAGFLLGNSIMSFYINGFSTSFLKYREIGLAIGLFYLFINFLQSEMLQGIEEIPIIEKRKYALEKKEKMALENLENISDIFKELGSIFKESTEEEKAVDSLDLYGFVDKLVNSVCNECAMKKFCWEEDFYITYHSMFKLIELIDKKECFSDEELPKFFNKKCVKKNDIVQNGYKLYDVFRVEYKWKETMLETRELISEQLEGISEIVDDVTDRVVREPIFNEDLEEIIHLSLLKEKVNVLDVRVSEFPKGDFEIDIGVGRSSKPENSLDNVKNIASKAIDIPLKSDFNIYKNRGDKGRYKLIKANRYGAVTKIAKNNASKASVSGDSYTVGERKNTYFNALSDGMGIGLKANKESAAAISVLEKCLEAGFNEEIILKTINSMLVLKSNDEIFTTLDISLLDLYSGKLQLIKTGAASTFIKRKDRVEVISSQSLPVGILKDVDFQGYETYLEDGDFLIMMSDGLLEANTQTEEKERWMKDVIKNIDTMNPETMANGILQISEEVSNGAIKDDMTVLVTKMWKVY